MTAPVEERSPLVLAGRWKVDHPYRLLGFGHFAKTFAGTDLETDRPVAIKLLNDEVSDDVRERFLREASVHANLDHPAIVELLGHGSDGKRHFLVTPLLPGGSVGDVVLGEPGGRLSPSATLPIATRIADALVYLRKRKLTHGDISPGNILLDECGQAFLADFGFSKVVTSVPLGTTSDRFGTEGYRAPRALGERRTYEDDIFSLAAVLWFCLTGESPLHRDNRDELTRPLRAPLERALRWRSTPTAARFRADVERHWAKPARDWRVTSTEPTGWGTPALVGCGVAGVIAAALSGHQFERTPIDVAHVTLKAPALTMRLDGRWQELTPPSIAGMRLRSAVSATDSNTQVAAGLSGSEGASLIRSAAIEGLPPRARSARRTRVGRTDVLRYGPVRASSGRAVEMLAVPLERSVLVVWCEGAVAIARLRTTCARAVAGARPLHEARRPLSPNPAVAGALRRATRTLGTTRERTRAHMASATRRAALTKDASAIARAYDAFAAAAADAPTGAQDRNGVQAVAAAARRVATAYEALAESATDSQWTAPRTRVINRERDLDAAMRRLKPLGYSPAAGER